jgi:hypothetical protein
VRRPSVGPEPGASQPPEIPGKNTATTEKLRTIVKLLAEVLRDPSFKDGLVPDVESGALESDTHLRSKEKEIGYIWSKVKPFNTLLRVPENPNMRSRFQELFSHKGYIDRLFTLTFKGSSSMEENLRNGEQLHIREELAKEYACMLSWRFKKLEGKPECEILFGLPSPGSIVNFKVLACYYLVVGGSKTRIGDILNNCYHCGVLEQPTSAGDIEKYSIQILIVFQALSILNFIRPLGNPEGANLRPNNMASSTRQYRQ